MKRTVITLLILSFTILSSIAQKKHFADNAATQINWKGGKIVGNSHTGTVDLQSGWLSVDGKTITGGEFVVDMTVITSYSIHYTKLYEWQRHTVRLPIWPGSLPNLTVRRAT